MGRLCLKFVLFTLACGCMCGCQAIKDYLESFERGGSAAPKKQAEDTGDAANDGAVYYDGIPRIRPGVAMVVTVGATGQQPTVMQVQVDQKGEATLQYLLQDPVLCNGLTLEAFKQKLVKCYQVYIKQPVVTVAFMAADNNNSSYVSPYGTVTVLGEVQMPGPVNMPATMDLTVTKVLKLAGGLKPFANKSMIRVTSCDKDGNKKRTYINLNEIGREGLIDKDIALRAGDVVWVPESWY